MDNQKEKIRAEYENGAGAKELAEKYNIKDSTIRVWAKRYKWNKKKQCNAIKKKRNNVTLQKKETLHVTKENVTESQKRNIVEKIINEEEKKIRVTQKYSIYKKLTEKEKEFIRNYFACKLNVKLATLQSGYKDYTTGYMLLRKEKIRKIIDRIKRTFADSNPLLIDPNYINEELLKNHLMANGTLKQKQAELVEKKIKKPVVVDLGGKKVVKYEEFTEAEIVEYEAAITDLRASTQSLQLLAKLKGFDKPQAEENKEEKNLVALLQSITAEVNKNE
nr:MAG TPA: Terminase small subunit [Caudoviricetes sp.]